MRLPFDLFCSPSLLGTRRSSLDFHVLHAARAINSANTRLSINACNGNVVIKDSEFIIKEEGMEFAWGMQWNSSANTWVFAGVSSLIVAKGYIQFIEFDGRKVIYQQKGKDNFICSEPGVEGLSTINKCKQEFHRFSPATGIIEVYNHQGNFIKTVFPNGKTLECLHYDAAHQSFNIKLPSGRLLTLSIDPQQCTKRNLHFNNTLLASYILQNSGLSTLIPMPNGASYQTTYLLQNNILTITSSDLTNSQITFGDGGKFIHFKSGEQEWFAEYQPNSRAFTLKSANDTAFTVVYDAYQHLAGFANGEGEVMQFSCDSKTGQLLKIIYADKESKCFSYDATTGLVKSTIEEDGAKTIENTYYPHKPLLGLKYAVTHREGSLSVTHYYLYDNQRQLVAAISPEGRVIRYEYDQGRLVKMKRVVTKFFPTESLQLSDKLLETWQKWWDTLNPCDLQKLQITSFTHDAFGRVIEQCGHIQVNENGEGLEQHPDNMLSQFQWDELGNLTKEKVCRRIKTQWVDNLNRIHYQNDAGLETHYEYQENYVATQHPNGLQEIRYFDASGLLGKHVKQDRIVEIKRYPDGSKKCIQHCDGLKTYYLRDLAGRIKYIINSAQELSAIRWDTRENQFCFITYKNKVDPECITTAMLDQMPLETITSHYHFYDASGNLRFKVNVKHNQGLRQATIIEHKYQFNKKINSTYFEKTLEIMAEEQLSKDYLESRPITLKDLNRSKNYFHDKDGLLIGKQVLSQNEPEPQGFTTQFQRDAVGNILKEICYLEKNHFSNALVLNTDKQLVTTFEYDNLGRKIAECDPDNFCKQYTYFPDGMLASILSFYTAACASKPQAHANDLYITYQYNAWGKLQESLNYQSKLICYYEYDKSLNLTSFIKTDLTSDISRGEKWIYNIYNEQIAYADPALVQKFPTEEDAQHWILTHIHPQTGLVLSKKNALGFYTHYFYNNKRQVEYTITANGACTQYKYGIHSDKVVECYQFSQLNVAILALLASAQRSGFSEEWITRYFHRDADDRVLICHYDENGNLLLKQQSNGTFEEYRYNNFNEVIEVSHRLTQESTLKMRYQYDLRGNIIGITKDPAGLNIIELHAFDDALNRITTTISPLGEKIKYVYEGLRSVIRFDAANLARYQKSTFDAFYRLSIQGDWMGVEIQRHEYEANKHYIRSTINPDHFQVETHNAFGEIISVRRGERTEEFTFNPMGYMETHTFSDGTQAYFQHNLLGQPILQINRNGKRIFYTYDEMNRLIELKEEGKQIVYSGYTAFDEFTQFQGANGLVSKICPNYTLNNTSIITDPDNLNLSTIYSHNTVGGLIRLAEGTTSDNSLYVENYQRDVLNRETKRWVYLDDGAEYVISEQYCDALNNIILTKDSSGNTKNHFYDARGNLIYSVDEEGYVTHRIYNANNVEIFKRSYAQKLDKQDVTIDQLLKMPNSAADAISHKIYDAEGLLAFEVNLLDYQDSFHNKNAVTEYSHNEYQEVIKVKWYAKCLDNINVSTPIAIDIIQKWRNQFDVANHPDNRSQEILYDLLARPVVWRNAEGYVTKCDYQGGGNCLSVTYYAECQPYININPVRSGKDRKHFFIYDLYDNLRYHIDGERYVIAFEFDATNHCNKEIHYYHPLSATHLGEIEKYIQADPSVNSLLDFMASVLDKLHDSASDYVKTYHYDVASRLIGVTDADNNTEHFSVNALGLNIAKYNSAKDRWVYEFDRAKRFVREISPAIELTRILANDSAGLIAQHFNEHRLRSLQYDKTSHDLTYSVSTLNGEDKRQLTRLYDRKKQFSGTRLNDDLTVSMTLDFAGRVLTTTNESGYMQYNLYDAAGRLRFMVDKELAVTEFQYDHSFNEYNRLIRYEDKLNTDITLNALTQFVLSLKARNYNFSYNRLGLKTKVEQDPVYCFNVNSDGNYLKNAMKPTTLFSYNAFGEVSQEEKCIDENKKSLDFKFYDNNGNVTHHVSPKGYLTQHHWGCKKLKEHTYLELNRIEFYNPLPEDWQSRWPTLNDMDTRELANPLLDRIYEFSYNSRLLLIHEQVRNGIPFYIASKKPDGFYQVNENSSVYSRKIQYDCSGNIIAYRNAQDESRYLNRNACGDVILESEFPLQLAIEDHPILPLTQHFLNVHGEIVGHKRFAKSAILADEGILKGQASEEDQQSLMSRDNRGLISILQKPTGHLQFFSYNAQRKIIQHFYFVQGYPMTDKPTLFSHLRFTQYHYNKNNQLIQKTRGDENVQLDTFYQYNTFNERIAEGPAFNKMLLFWCFDQAGRCWYNNADKGIATLNFHDGIGNEVIQLRSAHPQMDLSKYQNNYETAVQELLDGSSQADNFKNVQHTLLQRNETGLVLKRFMPWFSQPARGLPEVIQVAFTIMDHPGGCPGRYLTWRLSDEKLLYGIFKLSREEGKWESFSQLILPAIEGRSGYRGINLSQLLSGQYEYQLDFYLLNAENEISRFPVYCAVGKIMLDMGNYPPNQLIWYLRQENTLVLTGGDISNIWGIELQQLNSPSLRLGKSVEGQSLVFDLQNLPSGDYDFKIVTAMKPLENKVLIQSYTPSYQFDSPTTIKPVNALPPEIKVLKQEYFQAGQPQLERLFHLGDSSKHSVTVASGKSLPGVKLYGYGEGFEKIHLGNFIGYVPTLSAQASSGFSYYGDYHKFPVMQGEPIALVRSLTPVHGVQINNQFFATLPWCENCYKIINPPLPLNGYEATAYVLADVATNATQGKIHLRTSVAGTRLLGREIAITQLQGQRYKIGGIWYSNFQSENAFSRFAHFAWQTNLPADYHLQLEVNGVCVDAYDVSCKSMGFSDPLYMHHLLPRFTEKALGPINVKIVLANGDIISAARNWPAQTTIINAGRERLLRFNGYASFERQLLDISHYPDIYLMYFSPLPGATKQVKMEYAEYGSINQLIWRGAETQLTRNGFTFANQLPTGKYPIRIQLLNQEGNILHDNLPGWSYREDGWAYHEMLIQKGVLQHRVFVSDHKDHQLEIVKSNYHYEWDRYNNLLRYTDPENNTTDRVYNIFNKVAVETSPFVTVTDSKGCSVERRLQTNYRYDLDGSLLSRITPAGGEDIYIHNHHAKLLYHLDPDNVWEKSTFDRFGRLVTSVTISAVTNRILYSQANGLTIQQRFNANDAVETLFLNEDNNCIHRIDRTKQHWYYNYNFMNQQILKINPLNQMQIHAFHARTGGLAFFKDEQDNAIYYKRDTELDDYVGNVTSYIDYAGQVIHYELNPNKQLLAEIGITNAEIDLARGRGLVGDQAPAAKNIRYIRSEAGHLLDIIDIAANLTTHRRYNKNNFCSINFFKANEGKIVQANFSTYDALQRIIHIHDTRIAMRIGYDANSNRRYAQAWLMNESEDMQSFRESWFDYTLGNRPLIRDGILYEGVISLTNNQGLALEFQKGVVVSIKEIINNSLQQKFLYYDNLNLLKQIAIKNLNSNSILNTFTYTRDYEDYIVAVANVNGCQVFFLEQKPNPSDYFHYEVPTYVLVRCGLNWNLYFYQDKIEHEIIISNDPLLKDQITIHSTPAEIEKIIHEYHLKTHGKWDMANTLYDEAHGIKEQAHHVQFPDGNQTYTIRTINKQSGGVPLEEVTTTYGELLVNGKQKHYTMVEKTTNKLVKSDNLSIGEASTTRTISAKDIDVNQVQHRGDIFTRRDANGNIIVITGDLSANTPESYREFIINSEKQVVSKITTAGKNYYFYAEKKPGKMVLMAYFGDLPDDLKRVQTGFKLPNTINLDLNHEPITANYPPVSPSVYTAPRAMTYREIAEELNYTGYAASIAHYNHANLETKVSAGEPVQIPPLYMEVPDTAWNGSVPDFNSLSGSMSPSLSKPSFKLRTKPLSFLEEFLEVAAGIAIMAYAPALIASVIGTSLTAMEMGEAALVYGAAGALANAIDQGIALGFGSQKSFDYKSLLVSALSAAVTDAMLGELNNKTPQKFDLGNTLQHLLTIEGVALTQQAMQMLNGGEMQMDWRVLAASALEATVSAWQASGAHSSDPLAHAITQHEKPQASKWGLFGRRNSAEGAFKAISVTPCIN